jgi:hypothetical protein
VNEDRLRELHHRVEVPISGGMTYTTDGVAKEIIASKVSCCSCLHGDWEKGPCLTLEAIEDDGSKDSVEIVTWGADAVGTVVFPLEGYRGD